MQKVDIAIGVMGAIALIATGLGIAFYDDINDLTHYHVDSTETAFENTGTTTDGGLDWTFEVPDNTYQMTGDLTMDWSASANPTLDGPVDIVVTMTAPDGTQTTVSESFEYSSGSGVIALAPANWGEQPEEFTGSEEDLENAMLVWSEPFTLSITIQGPSGQIPGPVTQDDPAYTADLAATWFGYHVAADIAEPEAA